jgi:peptide/nickel transport system permease protein
VSATATETTLEFDAHRPARGHVRQHFLELWTARVGLTLCLLILGVAVVGPYLSPHDPTATLGVPFQSPTRSYPFGLDFLGRDVLSRWLHGGRSIVILASLATLLGTAVGTLVGLVAGYKQNWLDSVLMRVSDTIYAFPEIILVLVLVSIAGPQLWLVVCAVAAAFVPRTARLVRGLTLEFANADFVEAAVARGEATRWIVVREILPNIASLVIIELGLRLSAAVTIIASVAFLGFGLQPPGADWGLMINENRGGLTVQPWAVFWPAITIAILAIGVNLVADASMRVFGRF